MSLLQLSSSVPHSSLPPLIYLPSQNLNNLREFLLVKLINGEKATFQTPTFSKKRERTLEMLIKDLYEEYMQDSKLVIFLVLLMLVVTIR